jgi:hypothetical protein
MATFPALEPATRRYTMGVYPATEERGFGGGSVRFRHSSTPYGHNLELGFAALTQAEALLLRDHYRGQQGGYIAFPLSAEAWAGHSSFNDLVPSTTNWRYASQPQEEHLDGGYVNVQLSLISVPAVAVVGLEATITISFGVADMINARPTVLLYVEGGEASGS